MTATAERTDFLKVLSMSQLLGAERLKELAEDLEFPQEPGAMAEKLVQSGELSRFQAKQLLAGKYRGFILGPYKLLDQIGKGGMGTVFLGEHASAGKKVAIKVLAKELANDSAAIARFSREAQAASALAHPNVVRVHHVGQTGDNRYLVMEYVNGATLEQILDRKGPFSVTQAVRIAMQAAAGLHHAHEKGFVHRDIKPENLMLTKEGQIKILDMGLTKSVNKAEDNLTGQLNTTAILGTIDYLSPEQAMQGTLDHRSDIYSLGATLFTLITGHSPYEGVPARQKLMQHQCGAVPNLADFTSDVPQDLAAVVVKMMAKKAADRHDSMADVVDALKPWADLSDDSTIAGVSYPSGITTITMAELRKSMTPTLKDVNTASLSGVVSQPVLVALPEPIVKAPSGVQKMPAAVTRQDVTETPKKSSMIWIILAVVALAAVAAAAVLAT